MLADAIQNGMIGPLPIYLPNGGRVLDSELYPAILLWRLSYDA